MTKTFYWVFYHNQEGKVLHKVFDKRKVALDFFGNYGFDYSKHHVVGEKNIKEMMTRVDK